MKIIDPKPKVFPPDTYASYDFGNLSEFFENLNGFCEADNIAIWLQDRVDPDVAILIASLDSDFHEWLVGHSRYRRGPTKYKGKEYQFDGLTGYVFTQGETINVPDVTDEKEIQKIHIDLVHLNRHGGEEGGPPRAYLAVPLINERKKCVGVLALTKIGANNTFNERAVNTAVQRSQRLIKTMTVMLNMEDRFRFLSSIKQKSTEDLTSYLTHAAQIMRGDHLSIFFLRSPFEDKPKFYLLLSTNREFHKDYAEDIWNFYYELDTSKTGSVLLQEKAMIFSRDNIAEGSLNSSKEPCETDTVYSWVGVPIFHENRIYGIIRSARGPEVFDKNGKQARAFQRYEIRLLHTIAESIKLQLIKQHVKVIETAVQDIKDSLL